MVDKTRETETKQDSSVENRNEQLSKKVWFGDKVKPLLKINSNGVIDAKNERMIKQAMKENEIFPSDYKPTSTTRRFYTKVGEELYYFDSTKI